MLLWALSLVFPVVMILSMLSDLRTFEIPNRLPLALVVGYPLAALSAGLSWQPQLWAFALGGLMLVIAVIMFVLGLMGGGDGKLLAAAAIWTGPERVLDFLIATALAGGILALALLVFRHAQLLEETIDEAVHNEAMALEALGGEEMNLQLVHAPGRPHRDIGNLKISEPPVNLDGSTVPAKAPFRPRYAAMEKPSRRDPMTGAA